MPGKIGLEKNNIMLITQYYFYIILFILYTIIYNKYFHEIRNFSTRFGDCGLLILINAKAVFRLYIEDLYAV